MTGGAVFLFVVLLITSLFGKKGLMEIRRTRKSYDALLVQMKTLEATKARLEKEIAHLQRDPRAVEREARQKLWLVKKDEIVIVDKKK
jgi:cell division protein FtsB